MLDDIMYVFEGNIRRIKDLLILYEEITSGKGRKSERQLDLLRATVVLIHSTLEDYLRSLLSWKLPLADREKISDIPLYGTSESGRRGRFQLSDLVAHKNLTVEEVINLSIREHLNFRSFNNTTDIVSALGEINISLKEDIKTKLFKDLGDMISRRHKIVHQADRSHEIGMGRHRIQSISLIQVRKWKTTLDKFVFEVNKVIT
jgi:RiboL-PSP-HEPN